MAEEIKAEGQNQQAQEQTPSDAGQASVKEPVVVIDGKERPLKNYEAELKRKHDEEVQRLRDEYEEKLARSSVQSPQVSQADWLNQVYTMAENEVATTGKAVPIQTIMQVANSISQRNLDSTLKSREQSERTIRSFKRLARKDSDFVEMESDFDELVDQLKPEQINAPTLEVVLNAVRGKRTPEMIKRIREQVKSEMEKEAEILGGSPTEKTGGGRKSSSTLTPEQKREFDMMNSNGTLEWTEEEYKQKLKNKQERFKAMGAKNTPQLLNDQMIK